VQSVLAPLSSFPAAPPLPPVCSCCCPSLVLSTLLHCDSSHVDVLPLNLQLIDQCTLLVSAAVESPVHLWESNLAALFQQGLLTRMACLRPSFSVLYCTRSTDYHRLLKLTLMALMIVHDSPSSAVNSMSPHLPLASDRFFPTLLHYFQIMMDGTVSLHTRCRNGMHLLCPVAHMLCCVAPLHCGIVEALDMPGYLIHIEVGF